MLKIFVFGLNNLYFNLIVDGETCITSSLNLTGECIEPCLVSIEDKRYWLTDYSPLIELDTKEWGLKILWDRYIKKNTNLNSCHKYCIAIFQVELTERIQTSDLVYASELQSKLFNLDILNRTSWISWKKARSVDLVRSDQYFLLDMYLEKFLWSKNIWNKFIP